MEYNEDNPLPINNGELRTMPCGYYKHWMFDTTFGYTPCYDLRQYKTGRTRPNGRPEIWTQVLIKFLDLGFSWINITKESFVLDPPSHHFIPEPLQPEQYDSP